mgnify:CR=1 FL=1
MSTEKSLLPGATRDLAAFAAKLQYNDIPREAIERMKLSVLRHFLSLFDYPGKDRAAIGEIDGEILGHGPALVRGR